MRTTLTLCLLVASAVSAEGMAKALEIDTVILLRDGDRYLMQYTEAGRADDGSPIIRTGDPVPLVTDADKKLVKPLFDTETARAKPAEVKSLVLGKDARGSYFVQHTAMRTLQGRTTQANGPLVELPSAKERKAAMAVFGLAKRARTGK